jgi:hypothetical protein
MNRDKASAAPMPKQMPSSVSLAPRTSTSPESCPRLRPERRPDSQLAPALDDGERHGAVHANGSKAQRGQGEGDCETQRGSDVLISGATRLQWLVRRGDRLQRNKPATF